MAEGFARSAGRTASAESGPLALAEAAFYRGQIDLCRQILTCFEPASKADRGRAALLLAECARSVYDFAAVAEHARRATIDHPTAAGRLHAGALHGFALRDRGPEGMADGAFDRVLQSGRRDPCAFLGMPAYLVAFDAWRRERNDDAERLALENVAAGASVAQSRLLLAFVAFDRERYIDAGAELERALRDHRASAAEHARLDAALAYGLAMVAHETIDLRLARIAYDAYDRSAWPACEGWRRFDTVTELCGIALLRGDLAAAQRFTDEAVVRAPNNIKRTIGEANSAYVYRLCGEDTLALQQLERAWTFLRKRRWGGADDEARVALTNFAIEAAEAMPAEARQAMTMFASLAARRNSIMALDRDRRVEGFQNFAAGRVAMTVGDEDLARSHYAHAFDIFESMGCLRLGLRVAHELRALGDDARCEALVARVRSRAPRARQLLEPSPAARALAALTPAQRAVLGKLVRGQSARAIADELERSVHTVNNHTRRVFAAFEVTSRAALLVRCRALGVTEARLQPPR